MGLLEHQKTAEAECALSSPLTTGAQTVVNVAHVLQNEKWYVRLNCENVISLFSIKFKIDQHSKPEVHDLGVIINVENPTVHSGDHFIIVLYNHDKNWSIRRQSIKCALINLFA